MLSESNSVNGIKSPGKSPLIKTLKRKNPFSNKTPNKKMHLSQGATPIKSPIKRDYKMMTTLKNKTGLFVSPIHKNVKTKKPATIKPFMEENQHISVFFPENMEKSYIDMNLGNEIDWEKTFEKSSNFEFVKKNSPMKNVRTLGKGAFGEVTLSKRMNSSLVAVKTVLFKSDYEDPERNKRNVESKKAGWAVECVILNKLKNKCSDYVLCLDYCTSTPEKGIMIMEALTPEMGWMPLIELIHHVHSEYMTIPKLHVGYPNMFVPPSFENANKYTKMLHKMANFVKIEKQLVDGLHFIHKNNIAHRDVKPHNIMVNINTSRIKYFDFGLSVQNWNVGKDVDNMEFHVVGTPVYTSPEYVNKKTRKFSFHELTQFDKYSLGITMYSLYAGNVPYECFRYTILMSDKTNKKVDYVQFLGIVDNFISNYLEYAKSTLSPDIYEDLKHISYNPNAKPPKYYHKIMFKKITEPGLKDVQVYEFVKAHMARYFTNDYFHCILDEIVNNPDYFKNMHVNFEKVDYGFPDGSTPLDYHLGNIVLKQMLWRKEVNKSTSINYDGPTIIQLLREGVMNKEC